jgi:dTDP-4-amino-4,6-dideoxygalactose transaminase
VSGPWRIPLSDVAADDAVLDATRDALASGWWSMGPRVEELEAEFARFCGSRHALAVASGTAALQLAVAAVGCGPGDEVVLPSLNFVAAANAVTLAGAVPVFCDIRDDENLNLDAIDLESRLGPRTRAVIALHYAGLPCDMDAVVAACRTRGVRVIEDAAHAPGAVFKGRRAGSLGDIGCFSLFANKNLPIGEGGLVVTDDEELARRMRLLRSHGMTTLTWDRHRGHAESYDVLLPGFNFRLDEVRASIALVQLGRLEARNRRRGELVARYRAALDAVDGVAVAMPEPRDVSSAHHLAVVVFDSAAAREAARRELRARRIQTSLHYPPIHLFSAYAGRGVVLPRTETVAPRLLTLPLHPGLTDADVDLVVDGLCAAAGVGVA